MSKKLPIARTLLAASLFCLAAAPHAKADTLTLQSLELTKEYKMSNADFRAAVESFKQNTDPTADQLNSGNYPDQLNSANYPDQLNSGNYPDQLNAANYPDQLNSANYGGLVVNQARFEMGLPSPRVSD